jgi:hypothetical protein
VAGAITYGESAYLRNAEGARSEIYIDIMRHCLAAMPKIEQASRTGLPFHVADDSTI